MSRGRRKRRRGKREWRPSLSVAQILEWSDAHFARTGKWPTVRSGKIGITGEVWGYIDGYLQKGSRGLPGNWSLAQLLHEHRGKRNSRRLPDLTIEQILAWVDAHHERTGVWPKRGSGQVDGADETWSGLDSSLIRGRRGLPGGVSLSELLREYRGVRNLSNLPRLTESQILKWADAHYARKGEWPDSKSGEGVPEAPGETWRSVGWAMMTRTRGLRSGKTLAELLLRKRGVHLHQRQSRLSLDEIRVWAEAHHARTGRWPTSLSGPIPEAPGETWWRIESALKTGRRGLHTRTILAEFLTGGRRTPATKHRPLPLEQILAWGDAYFERHGRWPTRDSGAIRGAVGETWQKVNSALKQGNRGLSAGGTLARLFRTHRGESG